MGGWGQKEYFVDDVNIISKDYFKTAISTSHDEEVKNNLPGAPETVKTDPKMTLDPYLKYKKLKDKGYQYPNISESRNEMISQKTFVLPSKDMVTKSVFIEGNSLYFMGTFGFYCFKDVPSFIDEYSIFDESTLPTIPMSDI